MRAKILKNNKGFTLIEMAIVLVIIGLILGSVNKGKDVLNSAKQKKFYSSFIKGWELSCMSYYDRTGNVLGDGKTNGGTSTKNGYFDGIDSISEFTALNTRLEEVGLEVPTSNATYNHQFSYTGVYSGSITMSLQIRTLASAADKATKNVFYISNMPTDLAIAIDTVIDGQIDTTAGNFRYYPDSTAEWPSAKDTGTVPVMYIIDTP
jgi:prepilin-type N-terminal cleavage/methylation domain-containing protein